MGGSSSQTTGWNYRLAWHDGLAKGPWDALTEFRGADKKAWKGRVEANNTIAVYAPNLWGGDTDQGGVDGGLSVMFGEADQVPNTYLVSVFGPKTAAHRGMMTVAWEGGIWGANNPFAQKRSYRGERTYAGWDDGDCWYPETVRVRIEGDFSSGGGGGGDYPYRWVADGQSTAGIFAIGRPLGYEGTWVGSDDLVISPSVGSAAYGTLHFGDKVFSFLNNNGVRVAAASNLNAWTDGPSGLDTGTGNPTPVIVCGRLFVVCGENGLSFLPTPDATTFTNVDQFGDAYMRGVSGFGTDAVAVDNAAAFFSSTDSGDNWAPAADIHDGGAFYTDNGALDNDRQGRFVVGGRTHPSALSPGLRACYTDSLAAELTPCTVPSVAGVMPLQMKYCGNDRWLMACTTDGAGTPTSSNRLFASFDNGPTFTAVTLPTALTFDNEYVRSIAVDGISGRVVIAGTEHGTGARLFFYSDDLVLWVPIDNSVTEAIGINEVYGVMETPEEPPYTGRIAKNPAHMILYAHTQRHNGRQPRETVNLEYLTTQADWFYSRGFGLCWARNPQEESPQNFIDRIEKVAGCSFTQSLADGLWYLDVANGIYDLDSLPIINDDDVLKFKEAATVSDNVVNSVSVKYFDPERKESVITPPVRAMGLIAQFGEIHQTFEYPEIPIGRIAQEVAMRELLARITPTRAFEFDCRPTVYELRKNQYVRVQLPKRGIADMVCLVADIPTSGSLKSGAFQISLTQDIYSLPTAIYEVELGEDTSPATTPAEIEDQIAFEAPYIDAVASMSGAAFAALATDAGYVVGAAVDPGRMRDFTMMVAPDGGDYDNAGDGQFCPSCTSTGEVPPGLEEGIGFSNPSRMASVEVGDVGWWDGELVRVDAKDLDANTLGLGRGCGDTLPRKHDPGSRIFFYQSTAAFDPTQHIAGELLDVKLLTNSYSEQQDIDDATSLPVTMDERIDRPYIAGDYRLNDMSIYDVGTPTAGGGGGGGGGSGPTTPPALGGNGAPASTTPGPNGGFADDAPYPIPLPDVFDTDIVPDGGFDDPASLAAWRKKDGSPLSAEWTHLDDSLHHVGGGTAAAYCYGARRSMPFMPLPIFAITVTADVITDPSVVTRIGVAWGSANGSATPYPHYIEAAEATSYPSLTTVSHTWTRRVATQSNWGASGYPMVVFMPVIEHVSTLGTSNAKVDNVTMSIAEVPTPMTAETPDHIDFDAGLTGWTLMPDPMGTNPNSPTMAVSGGEVSMTPTSPYGTHRWVILDAPITSLDEIDKIAELFGEVWCNDDSVVQTSTGTFTTGGVAFGVATKLPGGEYAPFTTMVVSRGDWTLRPAYLQASQDESNAPGVTHHWAALMVAGIGKTAKFRNAGVRVTDEAHPI